MKREEFIKKFIEKNSEKVYNDIKNAEKASINNKSTILESEKCGCYYCLKIFSPSKIKEWIDYDNIAICPYCEIDSVIGDKLGFPITEEFLIKMKEMLFFFVDRNDNVIRDCYGKKVE